MKKVLFVAALGMLTLASCKKTYTCECNTSYAGFSLTETTVMKDTKKNAEASCNALEDSQYTTCAIK